jgi:predicted methyltransferase
MTTMRRWIPLAAFLVLLAGPAPAQDYGAILAAPDRSAADKETDAKRHTDKLLPFLGVKTGMKVVDVSAGGGYTTELLARAVGPSGKVYAQEPPGASGRGHDALEARLKAPELKNVTVFTAPFDDPIPQGVKDLDIITLFYNYHDITFMPVDRTKMDKAMFDALKPGGILLLADHSAAAGTGTSVAKTLHRIDEATVKQELEAAGFKLVATADYLRNPDDKRDTLIFRSPVPVDAFVHKYQKPL